LRSSRLRGSFWLSFTAKALRRKGIVSRMFTGIIEDLGVVRALRPEPDGASLTVAAERIAGDLRQGNSVAVNGVCLTVTELGAETFSCDLSAETLRRSTLGRTRAGMPVNLERPLAVGDRLDGHFVLGHVDGTGRLVSKVPAGGGCTMSFEFPRELERYLVYKGSIAVDGISLTVASLEADTFTVAIIPHTLQVTNLKDLNPGNDVNLETDILGKYVERFFQAGMTRENSPKLTFEYLKERGF